MSFSANDSFGFGSSVSGGDGSSTLNVVAVTDSFIELTAGQSGTVFTNEGNADILGILLPAAEAGLYYRFIVQNTNGIDIEPFDANTIRIAGSVTLVGGLIESLDIGDAVTLLAINSSEWIAFSVVGTWTFVAPP